MEKGEREVERVSLRYVNGPVSPGHITNHQNIAEPKQLMLKE